MATRPALKINAPPIASERGPGFHVGQYLPLDQIRTDGGTQARNGLDAATVAEYAESWLTLSHKQNGFLEMPLIVVYHDGESYWLADGFHRVAAYKRFVDGPSASASARAIRAEVRMGTKRDAVLHACGANATHGLRRTQADKRRAIETLLNDPEWRQWSDSEIARRCNVSHPTVAAVRKELYPENLQDSRTVERRGTTYQQKPPAAVKPPASPPESDLDDYIPPPVRRPKEAQPTRLSPGQPSPTPWPDPPEGWRWNRRGAPAHLIAPDGWETHDYNYPERALAEAQRRILSAPKAEREATAAPRADDTIVATIREKATALGMGLIWEDDEVLLHWPNEDIEALDPMSYTDALAWLDNQAADIKQTRAMGADRRDYEAAERADQALITQAKTAGRTPDPAQIQVSTWQAQLAADNAVLDAARAFDIGERARLTNAPKYTMIRLSDYYTALDHITTLRKLLEEGGQEQAT